MKINGAPRTDISYIKSPKCTEEQPHDEAFIEEYFWSRNAFPDGESALRHFKGFIGDLCYPSGKQVYRFYHYMFQILYHFQRFELDL